MKKLEDEKMIIPQKDLKNLQNKFLKIEGAMQKPDGTKQRYKDLPEEMTTFTKQEKEVLKLIGQNINLWYSTTTRSLDSQYKDIEEPLSEHYRKLGVLTGSHWVNNEGYNGLMQRQEIKLLESMTDRPYYEENNGKKAIDRILSSPYSGISGMSMASDEPAMHAQYIVDIKPVKIKTKDGNSTKYALFHDNTWGPAEHENVWIDENGLFRTDFAQDAGGANGFITGKDYRTGLFFDELLETVGEKKPSRINNKQYKKLGNDDESYKFPLLQEVIVPGESPKARDIVASIKANTMYPPEEHLDELKEYAQNMTRDEMQQKFKKFDLLYTNIYKDFQKLEDRITGKGQFDKGIATKKDYDNLPDNDPLKLLLETTAVLNSYYSIPDKKQFYAAKMTPKGLEQIKTAIRKEARGNFNYTFGKLPDIAEAGMINSTNEIHTLLENYQKDTGEKPDDTKIKNMISSLKRFDKAEFDGSMKHTIDLMVGSFRKSLDTIEPSGENYTKREQLIQNVRAVLEKNMYLNTEDLNSSAFKQDNLPAVEKWIDDIFDPVNDKEFVKIYNTLLDMPTNKFKEKYNHLLTDEALGIKPLTGYDILKKYRAMDSTVQDAVYNVYFCREYYDNVDVSKTTPSYTYTKLSRILDGGKYGKNKKSFDDIFLDYYYSLSNLTLEKGYGKIKDFAYKKYGIFPSYAKVETENPQAIEQELAAMRYNIIEAVESSNSIKDILETIKKVKGIKGIVDKYPDKEVLSEDDYAAVIAFALQVYNGYKDDDSIPDTVDAASKIPLLPPESAAKKFKKHINTIYNEFVPLETTAEGKPFSSEIKKYAEKIKDEKQSFISESIEPKYQRKAYELLNKWIQARSKKETDADMYFDEFAELYDKHRITLAPGVLFKTYLMMLAKPTDTNNPYKNMSKTQLQNIEEIKKTYEEEIASLLNSAKVVEMQNILMRAARNGNLNIVQKELQNTKIPLRNGKVINLYSKEGLTIMLKDLIDEKDTETALLFIDQLGLSELAVETLAGYISFDNAKKILKRSYNIFDAVDKQFKVVQSECDKLKDIDTDPNWKSRMEHSREVMIKACNSSNFKNTRKIIEAVMNNLIEEMEKKPDVPKYKLLSENIQYAKAGAIDYARKNVDALNESLEKIQTIYSLLHDIKLPPKSGCEKYIDDFDQKLEELEKFSDSLSHHFETIDITVGRNI